MEEELKPFQPVLVRDFDHNVWHINFFERRCGDYFQCFSGNWKQCLPYNDETKPLIGTTNSPAPPEPEFKWGDHVEVRDEIDDEWRKAVYLKAAESDNFPYVVIVLDNSTDITLHYKYKYCRHADW